MTELRRRKIEEEMRCEIANLVLAGEVKDPRVSSYLSITRVSVSGDVSHAKVFVSTFESEDALLKAVSGLNSAAGFIQGRISRSMRLRLTPKLTFHADQGIREGFEITGKMRDLGT